MNLQDGQREPAFQRPPRTEFHPQAQTPPADLALIGISLDELVYQVSADVEIEGDERFGMSIGFSSQLGLETARHRAGFDFRLRF